jgi:hypothetical protein
MSVDERNERSARGTALAPRHYQGPTEIREDVKLNRQYFSYLAEEGLVAGSLLSVMFTIERSAAEIWPHLRDFNRWLSDRYYSVVVGDSEGTTLTLSTSPTGPPIAEFEVTRVIPEHVIVFSQPIEPTGKNVKIPLPGSDGVSRGFQTFMLNEHGGQTVVTILLQHASVMAAGLQATEMSDDEAVEHWRRYGVDLKQWVDIWIPNLKRLVYDSSR